jgi:predicted ferric reductase
MTHPDHDPKFFDESEIALWQQQGALFVISHPDDEALFLGAINELKHSKVPVHIHSLTRGENGQINGEQIKRKKTKKTPPPLKNKNKKFV